MRRQTAEHRRAAIIRNHKKSRNIIKPDKKIFTFRNHKIP